MEQKKKFGLIGLVVLVTFLLLALLPAEAQEAAPAVAPNSAEPQPQPQLPSRENNFNLPKIVQYDGETITEGFWVISLCGKPVMVVYDTEDQMALPIIGAPLLKLSAQKAWELEDGPPLLAVPDLALIYPRLEMCEFLVGSDRGNDKVTPPPTRMK